MEPDGQRRPRPVEDRARGHRRAMRAGDALPPAVRQLPATDVPALIADETVRPAQPRQVVPAVLVRAEPRQELTDRPRIISTALERDHGHNLLRLSGDPWQRLRDPPRVRPLPQGCETQEQWLELSPRELARNPAM